MLNDFVIHLSIDNNTKYVIVECRVTFISSALSI